MESLFVEYLPLLMFLALLVLILLGFPVAFTLAGTALVFALIGSAFDVFYLTDLGFIPNRIWGVVGNFTLVAVPLFVFMGILLERSGIAEELLRTVGVLLRRVRGNMAITVVLVGALLAASTGIVGATVVTMGILSLPTMLQQGYDKEFSCGMIAASGTLGQIIPPSIVLILLGDIMNVDVGDLFIGALLPGLLLVGLYLIYILVYARLRSSSMPKPVVTDHDMLSLRQMFMVFVPPGALIFTVLGSILFGIASPTEAAACGATGAVLITAFKRKLTRIIFLDVAEKTATITAMVFMLLIGAQFFGVVFRGLAGDELIGEFVGVLGQDDHLLLLFIMLLIFILGFFLDFLEICFIVIPIIMPILKDAGYPLLWVAILIAVNLQTSFLTPPFGFALFYLKGVAPKGVTTGHIYRGIVPFVGIQLIALVILYCFPSLSLWLPHVVFD